ncbi:MAG: GNAT family N-acetyltransferase [Gammaproteobacteria bacterium]
MAAADGSLSFRREPRADDPGKVGCLVAATGFFWQAEIEVAVELVQERLANGPASGYEFLFAERDGELLGYTCFGPIALTEASYDLFWIAVDPRFQGQGVGRILLEQSEALIRDRGGRRVYIETSGRELYASTRGFYLKCGYEEAAFLEDFYAPGDGKLIYCKAV